mgnify:CR=1 FL=1
MCQLRNASTTIWIGTLSDWHIATLLTYKSHQILNQAETDRRATAIQEWQPVFREGEVANTAKTMNNQVNIVSILLPRIIVVNL